MARIRTIKPEFWDDEAIGCLSREGRLLFIATWNLADDEGLLRWTVAYIKATVFMYDDDLLPDDVGRVMAEVVTAGLIFSYVAGKAQQRLAYIVNFRRHQRINRPQPGKLPPPSVQNGDVCQMYARRDGRTCQLCLGPLSTAHDKRSLWLSLDHIIPRSKGGSDYPSNIRATHTGCNLSRGDRPDDDFSAPRSVRDALNGLPNSTPSESVRAPMNGALHVAEPLSEPSLPEGKGREGSGREGIPTTSAALTPRADNPDTAQTLIGEWIDNQRSRPPQRVIGQTAREVAGMLGEGIDPAHVRDGLTHWAARGMHPSTLPSIVNELMNGGRPPPRPSTTDSRVAGALALAAKYAEEEQP